MPVMTTVMVIEDDHGHIGMITKATGICCDLFRDNFGARGSGSLITTDPRTGVVGFLTPSGKRDGGQTIEANYCPFCGSPIHIKPMSEGE